VNSQSSASLRTISSINRRDRCNSGAFAAVASNASRQLQCAAKPSNQRSKAGSARGAMRSGASGLSSQRNAVASVPGIASGAAWLGVKVPQLPCEAAPPTRSCSSTVTLRPASSR